MKLLLLFAVFCCFVTVSWAQCTSLCFGVYVLNGGDDVIRFYETLGEAQSGLTTLVSVSFTARTGQQACDNNVCGTNSTCTVNTGDADHFECNCESQFVAARANNSFTCEDLDECAAGTDDCDVNASCNNTSPGFDCTCNDRFTGNGTYCEDLNECELDTDDCDTNANCTNTEPGYDCTCNTGYTGNGTYCEDIDECALELDDCHSNANCSNTDGSFDCTCNDGYSGNGTFCEDIDECTAGTDDCDDNANCTNTDPGYDCVCNTQYTGNGTYCEDVDECATDTDNCNANANCTNTEPGFTCTCNPGYTGDGVTCTEIDECENGTHDCHANATCTNTPGGFNCTCDVGFTGNGTYCEDIDECATPSDNNCDANATCNNTEASFTCTCNPGYTGDGVDCEDIDDCASNSCHTNATCEDRVNNYTCTCKEGYSGDGVDSCIRGVQNITINFYVTADALAYNTSLDDETNAFYIDTVRVIDAEIEDFVEEVDDAATINFISHNFSSSADGLGDAESYVTLQIFTDVEVGTFLQSVNTISESTLTLTGSANECELGIDDCESGKTCADTPYRYCCVHDIEMLVNVTVDEIYTSAFSISTSSEFITRKNISEIWMRGKMNQWDPRGCSSNLTVTLEHIFEGSVVHVLALLLRNTTLTPEDITDLLNGLANTTDPILGQILAAGDFDECIEDYLEFRNCSALAVCLNNDGGFTCECNATYYDNGTTSGEICINPIVVSCDANLLNVSILRDYYTQQNVSLDTLHLADETCNRTTHSKIIGDSIEFSVDINSCNTTWTYSSDNTSIIASNYVTNLPSIGVFTGYEIHVPFECAFPVDNNITAGFNATVDRVQLPNVQAIGSISLEFSFYEDTSYNNKLPTDQTFGSADTLNCEIAIQSPVSSISVQVDNCWGTPTADSDDTNRLDFIDDGCSSGSTVRGFNMLQNGNGPARFGFQAFMFRSTNAAYLHCGVKICTGTCVKNCNARRRRREIDENKVVYLTLAVRLSPDDPLYNLIGNNTGVIGIGNGNNNSGDQSIDLIPILSALLAFVLIVLLALLVVVLLRKRRSEKDEFNMTHVNMHAIGVKPPPY